jgi:hypothetical protein
MRQVLVIGTIAWLVLGLWPLMAVFTGRLPIRPFGAPVVGGIFFVCYVAIPLATAQLSVFKQPKMGPSRVVGVLALAALSILGDQLHWW